MEFLIKAYYSSSSTSSPPVNSTVTIDIIQNNEETDATCVIGRVNSIGYIHCVSNEPEQKASDTVKINPEKIFGSLDWKEGLNDLNNNILLASEVSVASEDKFTFYDANNMYFSGGKWHFNIQGKSTESQNTFGIYKVDIKIKRSTG